MEYTQNEYIFPIEVTNKVKVSYTDSPAHKGRLKYAVDFITPIGTPIIASADGIVVDVKQDSDKGGRDSSYDSYGNYIEIEHTNKEYSIYEHIKKGGSLVKQGDKVKVGQIIGYSGDTGWIAHLGPHLHFDVHKYVGDGPEDYETIKIKWKN